MRPSWWVGLLFMSLVGSTAGCVSDPLIRIERARVIHIDQTGVTVGMTMSVKNDNSFDVLVRDIRANVILDGVHFLPSIQTSPNVWLPSNATSPLQIPVLVPWPVAMYLLQSKAPMISYRAKGVANVMGSRTLKVDKVYPIDQEGTLSREELQATVHQSFFME